MPIRRLLDALIVAATATVATLAAPPAAATDWNQLQRAANHPGTNPSETAFTPANVGALAILWRGHFGDNVATEGGAVIAGPRIFVAGYDGRLSAFDLAGCGGGASSCEPLWQGRTHNEITTTPAVSGQHVLVASADRFLHVFNAAGCGAKSCDALWRGRLSNGAIDSSVTVSGDFAFVGDYGGRLSVFPLAGCGTSVCDPAWTAQAGPHEQLNSSPTVGGGFVYVQTTYSTDDDVTGRMLVFPAGGCGQATCSPLWTADLGGPAGTTASPVVVGDTVYVGSGKRFGGPNRIDHLFAFPAAGCGRATCQPTRTFDIGADGLGTTPAVAGGWLFATTQRSPDPNSVGVVAAFDLAGCPAGQRCQPTWTGVNFTDGFASSPAVVGHVVFVGKGPAQEVDAGVFAFDARGCGAGKKTCRALALVRPSDQGFYLGAPLAVARDRVAFVANDNTTQHSEVVVMGLP